MRFPGINPAESKARRKMTFLEISSDIGNRKKEKYPQERNGCPASLATSGVSMSLGLPAPGPQRAPYQEVQWRYQRLAIGAL